VNMKSLSRRGFLRAMGMGAAAAALPSRVLAAAARRRPNIVFILADDMGFGDVACQNPESTIPTPNLDRLAARGVRFTDAHSPSAVCTPTRYGVLTGRYCWRSRLKRGVLWCWARPLIEADRLTVGKLCKAHGYDTACIGKWHLGMDWPTTDGKPPVGMGKTRAVGSGKNVDFAKPVANGPTTRGFDYYFGTAVPNFPPYCFIENERTVGIPTVDKPKGMFGCPGPMLKGWKLENILGGLMAKAVAYIDAEGGRATHAAFRQTKGSPFFLYMPLTAPHTPIAPAEEFRGKSEAGAYGDFVHQVDHVVGQVWAALKRNGFEDNTLLIFTSDNGSPARDGTNMSGPTRSVLKYGHNPSGIYRGIKADAYEGGHRVPFLARWPGRTKEATTCDQTICHTDLLATVAGILGVTLPDNAGEDSYDIRAALEGRPPAEPIREATVHHSIGGTFCIRQGKWKLIAGRGSGGWTRVKTQKTDPPGQLYDMTADPSEKKNLWRENPDVVKRLTALLEKYRKRGYSRPRT